MKAAFLDKFIERIGLLQPRDVQNYVTLLAREKGFFETIFNSLHEGVIVTDPDGRINYLNEAACALFGLQESDVGKLLNDRVPGLQLDSLMHSEKVVTRDMEVVYPEKRFLNFYVVPLSLTAPPRRKKQGSGEELIGYAIILRDLTETRRSTQETIESERLSALTLLAAGVAHEIGNPLNSLHIHMQLMERKLRKLPPEDAGELEESLRVAKEEIKRLDFIVTQFLRAIRPQPLRLHADNVNLVVQESVSFLAPELQDRDILVEQELRSDLPLVQIDRDQLKQAFYNIIKNAVQSMSSGGILRIHTDLDDSHVTVSFADNGGGISPENMGKVFEPYFTTKQSGSGLGLLIVRRIVRDHGGELQIMSDEGRGTTVTIRLPFRDQRVRMLEAGAIGANPP